MVVETEEDDTHALLHNDWAEQHQLSEVKEVQSAYFAGRFHYEIHTAFIYSKGNIMVLLQSLLLLITKQKLSMLLLSLK